MTGFEEFVLEKSMPAWVIFNLIKQSDINEFKVKTEFIGVEALGNWAWEKIVKCAECYGAECIADIEALVDDYEEHSDIKVYLEIAVACLGRAEVERRLGELK